DDAVEFRRIWRGGSWVLDAVVAVDDVGGSEVAIALVEGDALAQLEGPRLVVCRFPGGCEVRDDLTGFPIIGGQPTEQVESDVFVLDTEDVGRIEPGGIIVEADGERLSLGRCGRRTQDQDEGSQSGEGS